MNNRAGFQCRHDYSWCAAIGNIYPTTDKHERFSGGQQQQQKRGPWEDTCKGKLRIKQNFHSLNYFLSVLWQVQDDLQYLRAAFARASEGDIDSRAVELALTRTEHGLQVACEQVEHSSSNNVVTLPAVKRDSTTKPVEPSTTAHGGQHRKSMKEVVSIARQKSPIKQAKRQQQSLTPAVAPNSLSPGQQVQAQHISHLMSQPTHPLTQQILTAHYGLPLPIAGVAGGGGGGGGKKESNRLTAQGQIVTGPTTTHLTTLPRANRRDAQVGIVVVDYGTMVTVGIKFNIGIILCSRHSMYIISIFVWLYTFICS